MTKLKAMIVAQYRPKISFQNHIEKAFIKKV